MTATMSADDYAKSLRSQDRAALGRAITLIESDRPEDEQRARSLLKELGPPPQGTLRLGVSGLPGVGKSTFIDALGSLLLEKGHRVAVLATDPSSVLGGGSILGDKTRMGRLSRSKDAFVRPSANRGVGGGIAPRTHEALVLCEIAGYDLVVVETVGVGQSDVAIADVVDLLLFLTLPGGGDELQGIKRGILELVDVLIVHKADGPSLQAAEKARGTYESALRILHSSRSQVPFVFACSSLENRGLAELWEHLETEVARRRKSGEFEERRSEQGIRAMWRSVNRHLALAMRSCADLATLVPRLEGSVRNGQTTPEEAADQLWSAFLNTKTEV